MPIYEYKCWNCGEFFSELLPMSATKEGATCPKCGGTDTTRVPSTFADLSKGSADCGDYGGFT